MINRLNIITVIFLCCFISGTSAYFTIKVGGGIVHDVSDAVDNTQFTVKHNPAFKIYFAGGWELTRTKRLEIEWGLTGLDAKKIKYTVGGKDFSIDVEDRAVGMIG
ncbi:MAG: hypothetical protein HRT87_08510, partial [Legionellales bacterium]|nr:hypothetical protein [Legionellales bacterium]